MIAMALLLLAPVLAHPVERGTILSESDFASSEGPTASNALSLEATVGREATRWLPAGHALRPGDVAPPRQVRRGDPVMLRLKSGGLVISTPARALADGRRGDLVRVVVTATNRTIDAHVEGTGLVGIAAP